MTSDDAKHDPLADLRAWHRRGREHGRRAVPSDAGKVHNVSVQLRTVLFEQAAGRRKAAVELVGSLDRERERVHADRARLQAEAASTPPGRERLTGEMAALNARLVALNRDRATACQILESELEELCQQAARADAAFREGYGSRARWKDALPAEADLALPDHLRGPIPDPLEGEPV